jgi:hypothetical protein
MKLSLAGNNTSVVEVSGISKHGLWLCVKGEEYFLSFKKFPWFKQANVAGVLNVKLFHGRHPHWPSLDVDLELEWLQSPEKYPLTYKTAG